jgi:hypothetical protein
MTKYHQMYELIYFIGYFHEMVFGKSGKKN